MSRRERRLTRRQGIGEKIGEAYFATTKGKYELAAAKSLDMDADTLIEALFRPFPSEDDLVARDAVLARCVEIAEARGESRFDGRHVHEWRAELLDRRGPGWFANIGQCGPVKNALEMLATLVLLLLDHPMGQVLRLLTSHKIQCGQLLARLGAVLKNAAWRGKSGGWRRQFTLGARRRSSSGHRSARTSSLSRASSRRSLSGSTARASTPSSSSASASRSTPSDEPADAWSDRQTLPLRLRLRCASSTDDRASGRREAWALYRLRVQNLLLELEVQS